MAVGLKDVAARADVAPITVSRVLNNSPLVAEATRDKVLAVCRSVGYQPHAGARALRSRRFDTVGLLLPAEAHRALLPYALLAGITDALAERGLNLHVLRLTETQLTQPKFVPRVLSERMVDGLLINYAVDLPQTLMTQVHDHHLPSIWINIKAQWDAVYPDVLAGVQAAMRALVGLGHRRIAYLDFMTDVQGGGEMHYSARDAWAGCLQVASEGSPVAHVEPLVRCPVPRAERPRVVREILQRADRPTAIVAASGGHVLACLHAALSLGLRVPEDLSLVTFHDAALFNDSGTAFGTISIPEADMGRKAIAMLIDKIRQPDRDLPSVSLPMPFVPGDTCSSPASKGQT